MSSFISDAEYQLYADYVDRITHYKRQIIKLEAARSALADGTKESRKSFEGALSLLVKYHHSMLSAQTKMLDSMETAVENLIEEADRENS